MYVSGFINSIQKASVVLFAIFLGSIGLLTGCSATDDSKKAKPATSEEKASVSQVSSNPATSVKRYPMKEAWFGELHLHTSYSLDAYIFGNTMNDPFTAYRFAKGESVKLANGIAKQITKPLDFAAVTDHAGGLGEYEICTNSEYEKYNSETCKGIRANEMKPFQDIFAGVAKSPAQRLADICGEDGQACWDAVAGPWARTQQAANEHYQPGKFTTLIAYEFSAGAPEGKGGMMHRNVIFKSDKVTDTVFGVFDGTGEELHQWLEQNCTGDCQVLTIPHNPNFYWGRLYWGKNSDGTEWTQEGIN